MKIPIITFCTGDKHVNDKRQLTLEDFCLSPEHVAAREKELADLLTSAQDLYSGMQHERLMRGIQALRQRPESNLEVDLRILSAGYGLVEAERRLAPYETTFTGMKKGELHKWAEILQIPQSIRTVLAEPYDLGLILLGDSYLTACQLDNQIQLGGPTLLLCGRGKAKGLPALRNLRVVTLSNPEARQFSCTLIGLKGELTTRILQFLLDMPNLAQKFFDPDQDVLNLLDGGKSKPPALQSKPRAQARINPRALISLHK